MDWILNAHHPWIYAARESQKINKHCIYKIKYTGGCIYLRHDFPMHHGSYNCLQTPGNPRCRVRPSRWCTPVLQLWSVWHRLWSWWCTWPGGKSAVNKRSQLPISQPLQFGFWWIGTEWGYQQLDRLSLRYHTFGASQSKNAQKVHSPNLLKRKCISGVARICIIIIFHLSKLWKAKFSLLCDVIFLVRLQEKFDIDRSQEWKG